MNAKFVYHLSDRWNLTVLMIASMLFHSAVIAQCISSGSSVHFALTGHNTTAGYATVYVLTNSEGKILETVTDGFAAPEVNGSYLIYAVNYKTSGAAPVTTAGTDITAIGGECVAVSEQPAQFCVNGGCVPIGASIAFQVTGNNTSPGYLTEYIITDTTGQIISKHPGSPVNAPSVEGTYRIYAVNYNAGTQAPNLAAGTNISEIDGACAAISSTPIEFCASRPMPVTLVSFSATSEPGTVQLDWVTTEEINAEKFEIQRSKNAKTWLAIGEQAAKGDSKERIFYQFTDRAPLTGLAYYRLKMIDRDKTYSHSRILNVQLSGVSTNVNVYPNPANEVLLLKENKSSTVSRVTLSTLTGTKVFHQATFPREGIDIKNLGAGIYFLEITWQGGHTESKRIVIAR